MKKWLHKIKQKNDLEKRNFALLASFLITSFIFLIWLVSVFNVQVDNSELSNNNVANPFESISNQFKEIVN